MASSPASGPSASRAPGRPLPPPTPPPKIPLPPRPGGPGSPSHRPVVTPLASPSGGETYLTPLVLRPYRNGSQDSVLSGGYQSASSQLNSPSESTTPTLAHFRDQRLGSPKISAELRTITSHSPRGTRFPDDTAMSSSSATDSSEQRSRLTRMQSTMRGLGQKLKAVQGSVLAGRSPGTGLGHTLSRTKKDSGPEARRKDKGKAAERGETSTDHRAEVHARGVSEDQGSRPSDFSPWTLGALGISPRSRQALGMLRRKGANKEREESLLPVLERAPMPPASLGAGGGTKSSELPYLRPGQALSSTSMTNLRAARGSPASSHVTFAQASGPPGSPTSVEPLRLRMRSSSLSTMRHPSTKTTELPPVPPLPLALVAPQDSEEQLGLLPRPPVKPGSLPNHPFAAQRTEPSSVTATHEWGVHGGRQAGRIPGDGFAPQGTTLPLSIKPSSSHSSHRPTDSDATTLSETLFSQSGRYDSSSSHTRGTSTSSTSQDAWPRKPNAFTSIGETPENSLGLHDDVAPSPPRDRLELKFDELKQQLDAFIKENSGYSRLGSSRFERLPPTDGPLRRVMVVGQHSIQRMANQLDPLLEKLLDVGYAQVAQSERGPMVVVSMKEADLDWLIEYNLYQQAGDLKSEPRDSENKQIRDRISQLKRLDVIVRKAERVFPHAQRVIEDALIEEYDNAFYERLKQFAAWPHVEEIAEGLRSMLVYRFRRVKEMPANQRTTMNHNNPLKIATHFSPPFELAQNQAGRLYPLARVVEQFQHSDDPLKIWLRGAGFACECLKSWLQGGNFQIIDGQVNIEREANKLGVSLTLAPPRDHLFEAAEILSRTNSMRKYERHTAF